MDEPYDWEWLRDPVGWERRERQMLELLESRMKYKPKKVLGIITPNPDSMDWLAQLMQHQVDSDLFCGVLGDADATTAVDALPDEGLTLEKLEQTVAKLLADVKPYDRAMQRLAERLKREPTIRYIADEWIPVEDLFWWEEHDVLLIAAAQLEVIKQQFGQLGITLIEVDEAWWQEMAEKDLHKWLRPHLPPLFEE